MSNLVQRTISGTFYVAAIVLSIVLTPNFFFVLFAAVSFCAVWEFCRLLELDKWLSFWSSLSAAVAFAIRIPAIQAIHAVEWVYLLIVIFVLVAELFRKQPDPIRNWGYYLTSQVLIAAPFALLVPMLFFSGWEFGRFIVLAMFVCVWANDTGAYLTGSLLGKHKMIPRVSPGKTWEGLIGGFIFSLVAGYIFFLCLPEWPLWKWLVLAFTISAAGTLGDLMESLFKRTIGVKDSGNVVLGRGGWLDCFDSTLLASPIVYALFTLVLG